MKTISGFFEKHCIECHDDLSAKGNFDVYHLDPEFTSEEGIDQWVRVFDRIASGEMPPPKKPQPSKEVKKDFLGRIEPRIIAGDQKRREVVQRRLNRDEYDYTIRDLLQVDIDLRKYLPEDQVGGGFTNNGEALAFSTELLESYLKAARRAVDEVIVSGEQPEVERFTVDSMYEVERYLPQGLYSVDEGRIVIYLTAKQQYSKVSSRKQRPKRKGKYRIRFEAATVNAKEPLVFSITKSDFARSGAVFEHVGFFEAESRAQVYELLLPMNPGEAIQFFAMGLPSWAKDPAGSSLPGIGFGPVTVEGPVYEEWPPRGHRELFGEVDPTTGTLDDAREILRRFAGRAFRRDVSEEEMGPYTELVKKRSRGRKGFRGEPEGGPLRGSRFALVSLSTGRGA